MIRKILVMCLLMMTGCAVTSAEKHDLKAFPEVKSGMSRFVISLSTKERDEEERFMVEIIAGKNILTDGVNQVRLGNTIETHVVKGYGHSYYEVTGSTLALSTRMAVPAGSVKVQEFVKAPSIKVNYNSRLPIVVFAPNGYEVRYQIWEASGQVHQAKQ